jgi:tripartite-type tricarboxylate transporter receptor subunit TctC
VAASSPFVLSSSFLLAALFLCLLATGCARKTDFPSHPITLVCPWSPGGGTDLVSRQIAALLERELGVPVNVVNTIGGGGVSGHTRGALARPDGYTITMITVELNMLHWRGLTSISHRDYAPLVWLNQDAAAVLVRADAPWKTLRELTEHIRANPGKLRTSGTAQGGIWHLALAGWLQAAGLKPTDAIWVSINGAGPSLQELLAGGVQVVCCSVPEARALLDARRVRCLGVMSDARLALFPDIPTFKEQGVDWSLGGWRGLAVPAKTPAPIVAKLASALGKIVQGDEFRRFMSHTGFNWSHAGPETFRGNLERLDAQFGALLTSAAFRVIGKHQIGAKVFPTLLGSAGVLVVACLLVTGGLKRDPQARGFSRAGLVRGAEVLGWIVAYLLLAEPAGFVVTSAVLLALLMWRLGVRCWVATAISLGVVPLVYHLFAVVLRVPLPQGWIGW